MEQKNIFLNRRQLMQQRLQGKMFLIPSFITVVGLFCGFLAIISALKGRLEYATLCIGLSFVFDGLDGRVARRLNATSAFGREFDSLSDLVTFGVAPAVTLYLWAFKNLADDFGMLVCFLYVACGATRLARFNVTTAEDPKNHFEGLPIPGAAAALSSIIYFHPAELQSLISVGFIACFVIAIALFMVSTLPYFSLKHLKLTDGSPRLNLLLLSITVGGGWYHSRLAIMLLSGLYALSAPALWVRKKQHTDSAEQADRPQTA